MQTIDESHIEKRLDDWKQRIESLYKQIDKWLDTYPVYPFAVPLACRERIIFLNSASKPNTEKISPKPVETPGKHMIPFEME